MLEKFKKTLSEGGGGHPGATPSYIRGLKNIITIAQKKKKKVKKRILMDV